MLSDDALASLPSVLKLDQCSVVVVMSTVREIWRGSGVTGSGGCFASWNMFSRNLSVGFRKCTNSAVKAILMQTSYVTRGMATF